MVVTLPVFQVDTFPLNDDADSNIPYKEVTFPVFHFDKSEINAKALLNIHDIVITELVSVERSGRI